MGRGIQGRGINFLPAQKGRVSINLILLLPRGGSHFLTKKIKGEPGDFTFMLIVIPPAHPPF